MLWKSNESIALCVNNTATCDAHWAEILRGFVDIPCALLNILHIIVLLKMPSLKETPTLRSLYLNMAVAGGLSGLFTFIRGNCYLMENLYRMPPIASAMFSVIFDLPAGMKFYIILFASYERYISICKPLYKLSSPIVQHFGRLLFGLWFAVVGFHITVSVLMADKVCFMGNSGPTIIFGLTNIFTLVAGCMTSALIIVTTTFTILVLAELRRMTKRIRPGMLGNKDREVINATKYVIIIMMSTILCLGPLSVAMFLWYFDQKNLVGHMLTVIALLVVLHGILDTIIFGWMSRCFREEVKNMLRQMKQCLLCRNQEV